MAPNSVPSFDATVARHVRAKFVGTALAVLPTELVVGPLLDLLVHLDLSHNCLV
jgi:hypothetical protein